MAHHALIRTEWIGPASWAPWQSAHGYVLGAYVIPTAAHLTGLYYKATTITTGISGGSEPVWPTVFGNTVVDGGVTWTAMYSTSVLSAEMATFDLNIKSAINVDGGCWSPAALLTVGGAGVQLTGPLVIARGGLLIMQNGRMAFDSGQFPQLSASHSGRTRPIVYSFVSARAVPNAMWRVHRGSSGMQSIAPTYANWDQPGPGTYLPSGLSLAIRGMQGATLSVVTVNFTVPTPHDDLPSTMPGFRVLRVDSSGNAVSCISAAAGADSNGWVYVTKPTTSDGWYSGGAPQSFAFTCDQNNVIDRTQYTYRLEVIDEQGLTGYPWQLSLMQPCKVMLDASATWPLAGTVNTVDGISLSAGGGDRVLVVNSLAGLNGIYISSPTTGTTGWQPAPDLTDAAQFFPGFVVGVQQGQKYGGSYWQASGVKSSWKGNPPPPGTGVWEPITSYVQNTPILPQHGPGMWFIAVVGGSSDTFEPAWPTVPGQTVSDNTVVWKCIGPYPYLRFVTKPDADLWIPGDSLQGYGTIFHTATVTFTGISQNQWQ